MNKQEYQEAFKLLLEKQNGKWEEISGAFGEPPVASKGIIERVERTPRGYERYFIGCTYPWRLLSNGGALDSCASTKRSYMMIAKLLLKGNLLFIPTKKNRRSLIDALSQIYEADLQKKVGDWRDWNPLAQSIVKAGLKYAESIPLERPMWYYDWDKAKKCPNIEGSEYRIKVENVFKAVASFVNIDGAYYFPPLDALSNVNLEAIALNPRAELLRVIDMALARWKHGSVQEKTKLIRFGVSMILLLPPAKRFVREYFKHFEVVQPDKADRYYGYRRQYYDFDGMSWESRQILYKAWDKEHEHFIIETNV